MAKIETAHARAVRDGDDEVIIDMKVPARITTTDTGDAVVSALRKWSMRHVPTDD